MAKINQLNLDWIFQLFFQNGPCMIDWIIISYDSSNKQTMPMPMPAHCN